MRPNPSVVGQLPKVARFYRELKNERMIRFFYRCPRRLIRRRKNLHAGTLSLPRAGHPVPAKTIITPYLERPAKDRLLDLLARPPPLGGIESRAWLYGRDFFFAIIGESDLAGLARKRETVGDSSTPESRTLTPLIMVRIQVPQPQNLSIPLRFVSFRLRRNSSGMSAGYAPSLLAN